MKALERFLIEEAARMPTPPEHEQALAFLAQEQAKSRVRQTGVQFRRNMEELLLAQSEIITDVSAAPRLAQRHNDAVISERFIAIMEALHGTPEQFRAVCDDLVAEYPELVEAVQGAKVMGATENMLQALYAEAQEHGMFVSRYSEEYEEQRIKNPDFLIAEGSIPAERDSDMRQAITDCQINIPPPDASMPVFEMPGEGDPVWDKDLVADIRANPHACAIMEDIACARSHDNRGFAGNTRAWAFNHIAAVRNPQRGGREVRRVAASIVGIAGFRRPDGTEVRLQRDHRRGMLTNEHSIIGHMKSRHPARLGYTLENRLVPVQIGGQTYHLIVDWFVFFQSLQVQVSGK